MRVHDASIHNFSVIELEFTVSSLHPHYDYECSVAAVTVGSGTFSSPITITTHQDSKCVPCTMWFEISALLPFLFPSAPSGPPRGINITTLSSASINVTWTPPLQELQNGIIKYYVLMVIEVESDGRREINGSNAVHAVVNDLHPYYSYKLSVAAFTIATGPFSNETVIVMPQDGKCVA